MAKQLPLEKLVTILAKLPLPDAIENYQKVGQWLHGRITEQQKQYGEMMNNLEAEKSKIKPE